MKRQNPDFVLKGTGCHLWGTNTGQGPLRLQVTLLQRLAHRLTEHISIKVDDNTEDNMAKIVIMMTRMSIAMTKICIDSGAAEPLGEPSVLCSQQQGSHKGGQAGHPEGAPNPIT